MNILTSMRELFGRPIKDKFRSATQTYPGDRLLLGLLGKMLSQPGLAKRVYGEGEVFLIKGGLFMSGVAMDEFAYEGVGTQWKEDLGQRHYDPDARQPEVRLLPHALHLPH